MTIHTRMHIDDPAEIDSDGTCRLCTAISENVQGLGRLLDLDELLEQAREEVRKPVVAALSRAEVRIEEREFSGRNDDILDDLLEDVWGAVK